MERIKAEQDITRNVTTEDLVTLYDDSASASDY